MREETSGVMTVIIHKPGQSNDDTEIVVAV
jgi:hypothetical protein